MLVLICLPRLQGWPGLSPQASGRTNKVPYQVIVGNDMNNVKDAVWLQLVDA